MYCRSCESIGSVGRLCGRATRFSRADCAVLPTGMAGVAGTAGSTLAGLTEVEAGAVAIELGWCLWLIGDRVRLWLVCGWDVSVRQMLVGPGGSNIRKVEESSKTVREGSFGLRRGMARPAESPHGTQIRTGWFRPREGTPYALVLSRLLAPPWASRWVPPRSARGSAWVPHPR